MTAFGTRKTGVIFNGMYVLKIGGSAADFGMIGGGATAWHGSLRRHSNRPRVRAER